MSEDGEGRPNVLDPRMVAALPVPILTTDARGVVTFWSDAMAALTGCPAEEVLGKRAWTAFFDKRAPTPVELALRSEQEEVDESFTVKNRQSGALRQVRFSAALVSDADGELAGVTAALTDRATAASASHLATNYLDLLPTPVVRVDRDYVLTYVNEAAAMLVGRTPEELLGGRCHDVFKTTHCRTPECRCAQAMQSGEVRVGETVVDPSGVDLPVRYTAAPERDDTGRITGALEYLVDITEEHRAVREVEALAERLVAGQLDARGCPEKYLPGGFRNIISGINQTLDTVLGPVQEATRVLGALEAYDLRARVVGDYRGGHARLKDGVNAAASALNRALLLVSESAQQFAGASQQIAASSQSVAQGASQQAGALQETAASLVEISSLTRCNAESTQQARGLATTAKSAADKGNGAMARMIDAMKKIRASAEGTAEIIHDINEIAFQTNLLALNAAVEAARAGDAGRGFAVVAEEVRNLAQRSKEAAKRTDQLIRQSVKLAGEGETISGEVSGSLAEIVDSVGKVTMIVGEIAAASAEQAQGVELVNSAVTQIDHSVQQAAANSEESSGAAEELARQSSAMAALVSKFQLDRTAAEEPEEPVPPVRGAPSPRARAAKARSNGGGLRAFDDTFATAEDPELRDF